MTDTTTNIILSRKEIHELLTAGFLPSAICVKLHNALDAILASEEIQARTAAATARILASDEANSN